MTAVHERPPTVFNLSSAAVTEPYVAEGAGRPPEEFGTMLEALVDSFISDSSPTVASIAEGELPRPALARFVADLHPLIARAGTIDGQVAVTGDWHGLETVVRLTHPEAVVYGYWQDDHSVLDRLLDLAESLGEDREETRRREPSAEVGMYLRMREVWAQSGFEVALASTFPEGEWRVVADALADGLVRHYGVPEEAAGALRALAAIDSLRARDRPAILVDVARSAYHQRAIVRAVRESFSVWRYMWDQWSVSGA